MMKKFGLIGWFFLGLFLSQGLQASDASNLSQLLGAIKTVHAHFSQSVQDGQGSVLQESQGEVYLKKPGKFRWETSSPFEQLIVTQKDSLWVYDIDLAQAAHYTLTHAVGRSPVLLLSGVLTDLETQYRVKQLSTRAQRERFLLFPKQNKDEQVFEWVRLEFERGQLNTMAIADQLGQTTNIVFTESIKNPALSDALFSFEPPVGIDVIDNRVK